MTPVIVGASTKGYLGYRESLDWMRGAVERAMATPGVAAKRVSVFLAPSAPLLESAVRLVAGTPIRVAAQDCSAEPPGPHTGDTSAGLLAELGVTMVEIGHAERRREHGETDQLIARKIGAALRAGLEPLVCVGELEPLPPEIAGTFCATQLAAALDGVDPRLVTVAYEPVWAIGADRPAPPAHTVGVIDVLRAAFPNAGLRVVYGGSADSGLLERILPPANGLFLGRSAHELDRLSLVLAEADAAALRPA